MVDIVKYYEIKGYFNKIVMVFSQGKLETISRKSRIIAVFAVIMFGLLTCKVM